MQKWEVADIWYISHGSFACPKWFSLQVLFSIVFVSVLIICKTEVLYFICAFLYSIGHATHLKILVNRYYFYEFHEFDKKIFKTAIMLWILTLLACAIGLLIVGLAFAVSALGTMVLQVRQSSKLSDF